MKKATVNILFLVTILCGCASSPEFQSEATIKVCRENAKAGSAFEDRLRCDNLALSQYKNDMEASCIAKGNKPSSCFESTSFYGDQLESVAQDLEAGHISLHEAQQRMDVVENTIQSLITHQRQHAACPTPLPPCSRDIFMVVLFGQDHCCSAGGFYTKPFSPKR